MRWFRVIQMRLRSLFGRPRLENELADELRFHLEEQIRENLNAGMSPDEAPAPRLRTSAVSTK